jgi:hypothetical protein
MSGAIASARSTRPTPGVAFMRVSSPILAVSGKEAMVVYLAGRIKLVPSSFRAGANWRAPE